MKFLKSFLVNIVFLLGLLGSYKLMQHKDKTEIQITDVKEKQVDTASQSEQKVEQQTCKNNNFDEINKSLNLTRYSVNNTSLSDNNMFSKIMSSYYECNDLHNSSIAGLPKIKDKHINAISIKLNNSDNLLIEYAIDADVLRKKHNELLNVDAYSEMKLSEQRKNDTVNNFWSENGVAFNTLNPSSSINAPKFWEDLLDKFVNSDADYNYDSCLQIYNWDPDLYEEASLGEFCVKNVNENLSNINEEYLNILFETDEIIGWFFDNAETIAKKHTIKNNSVATEKIPLNQFDINVASINGKDDNHLNNSNIALFNNEMVGKLNKNIHEQLYANIEHRREALNFMYVYHVFKKKYIAKHPNQSKQQMLNGIRNELLEKIYNNYNFLIKKNKLSSKHYIKQRIGHSHLSYLFNDSDYLSPAYSDYVYNDSTIYKLTILNSLLNTEDDAIPNIDAVPLIAFINYELFTFYNLY